MPKASDFVETEAIPDGMPQADIPALGNIVDLAAPQPSPCPICGKEVGKRVVTAMLPVQRPDGMWGHVPLSVHPYCAFMEQQGFLRQ